MAIVQQLNRSLGLRYVIVVVIGNIIGSGVYKKVAPMAAELHSSGWILICWILGGVITLFGALSNAEIAGMLANTGGEYVYYKKIYNRFIFACAIRDCDNCAVWINKPYCPSGQCMANRYNNRECNYYQCCIYRAFICILGL